MELRHPTLGLKGRTQADEVCENNEAEELPPENVPHSSQNGQMHIHKSFETIFYSNDNKAKNIATQLHVRRLCTAVSIVHVKNLSMTASSKLHDEEGM